MNSAREFIEVHLGQHSTISERVKIANGDPAMLAQVAKRMWAGGNKATDTFDTRKKLESMIELCLTETFMVIPDHAAKAGWV